MIHQVAGEGRIPSVVGMGMPVEAADAAVGVGAASVGIQVKVGVAGTCRQTDGTLWERR